MTGITKCDRKLLQSVAGIAKCDRKLLQSVTGITKCDRKLSQSVTGITKCGNYYKVERNASQQIFLTVFQLTVTLHKVPSAVSRFWKKNLAI